MAWSDLPNELLEGVFARLFPLDHLGFTAVCPSWRSVGLQQKNCYRPRQRNVALIVPGETADSETRRLLEPVQGQYSNDNVSVNLQIPHSYYCCGSSLGWLVLVDDSFDMQLVNPMTGVKFQLPSGRSSEYVSRGFDTVGKYTFQKAVLSSHPCVSTSSETIVFILYEKYGPRLNRMAFCKLGDTRWTAIGIPEDAGDYRSYDDAIYYKGKFHAIYNGGKPGGVVSCDLSDRDHPIVTDYAPPPTSEKFFETRYLVESNGELFQLRRHIRYDLEKDWYSGDSDEYDDYKQDEEQVECDDDEDSHEDEVGVKDRFGTIIEISRLVGIVNGVGSGDCIKERQVLD